MAWVRWLVLGGAIVGCGSSDHASPHEGGGAGRAQASTGGSSGAGTPAAGGSPVAGGGSHVAGTGGAGATAGTTGGTGGGSAGSPNGGRASYGGASGGGAAGAGEGGKSDALNESEACVTYYKTACNRLYYECDGRPAVDEPCANETVQCPDRLFGPASNATIEVVVACTALWAQASCDDLDRSQFPKCGFPAGDVAMDGACVFSSECATGHCSALSVDPGSTFCGQCVAALPQVGDPCESTADCPSDSACTDGTCVATYVSGAAPGALCTRYGQCLGDYRCYDTEDGSEMRCQPIPKLGEACIRLSQCVDSFCDDGVCAAAAEAGEPCSVAPTVTGSGTQLVCAPGATCDTENPAGPTCRPRGAAGEPCTPVTDAVNPRADCGSGLLCLCDDETCTAGHCSIYRYTGESCTRTGEACVGGNTCVNGVCQYSGLLGLHSQICGP